MAGHVLNALKPLAPVKARRRSELPSVTEVKEGSTGETFTASSADAPAPAVPVPVMIQSPFQIDHRGELIAELLHDAEVLEYQAQMAVKRAASLREAAKHLEEHPPEDA